VKDRQPNNYFVKDSVIELSEIDHYDSAGKRLLMLAFGRSYLGDMCKSVGMLPHLIEVIDDHEDCAFAALYTDNGRVKKMWSTELIPISHRDSLEILDNTAVIMDYTAVGYRKLYSECQLLRQVDFLTSHGIGFLNPPKFDVRDRIRRITKIVRSTKQRGMDKELCHTLLPGETFFYYSSEYFKPSTWNVFLSERAFIKVPLKRAFSEAE
jgi:hypothetical protein